MVEAQQRSPEHAGPTAAPRLTVVVGSGHKVGSTWLLRLIRDACGLEPGTVPAELTWTGPIRLDLPEAAGVLAAAEGRRIFKAHASAPLSRFPGIRVVSIHRDPRDVVVSTAAYLSWLPVEQGGKGEAFAALPLSGRIREIIGDEYFLDRLEQWHASGAYQVRYEDLLADSRATLEAVLDHLGERPPAEAVDAALERNAFASVTGRQPGTEDRRSFFRKGVAGDWVNHFDAETTQAFAGAHDGRWVALLRRMGYEGFD